MTHRKSNNVEKPGYREPRTADEKQFWNKTKPNFHEWIRKKKLTVDEAAALSMGLDPRCVESIKKKEVVTYFRFLVTKEWFSQNSDVFPDGIDLELIWVLGTDNGDESLNLPPSIGEAVDWYQDEQNKSQSEIARLEHEVARLKKRNDALTKRLVPKAINKTANTNKTAVVNVSATDAKIIVALVADRFRETHARKAEFEKLKAGKRTRLVYNIVDVVHTELGLKIDEATVLARIQKITAEYEINNAGRLKRVEKL